MDVLLIVVLVTVPSYVAAVPLLVALWLTVRMARSGVLVSSAGLVVRDAVRTHRIAWSQVLFVSPPSDDPAFRAVGVAVLGGRRVRCYALGPMRFERRRPPDIDLLYRRLNDLLREARTAGLAPA